MIHIHYTKKICEAAEKNCSFGILTAKDINRLFTEIVAGLTGCLLQGKQKILPVFILCTQSIIDIKG